MPGSLRALVGELAPQIAAGFIESFACNVASEGGVRGRTFALSGFQPEVFQRHQAEYPDEDSTSFRLAQQACLQRWLLGFAVD